MPSLAACFQSITRNTLLLSGVLAAGLFATNRLYAWDAYVSVENLESSFYVDTFSGNHTWTTLSEGISVGTGVGNSLINSVMSQDWNYTTWPSDAIIDEESNESVIAESWVEHYDGAEDEFFDYAEIYVFGDIPPDTSFGGSWFYEFKLLLDPFSTANVFLDSFDTYAGIESEAGDNGIAFAGLRLYSHDVGPNDPGGYNDPYDIDRLFLSAPPIGGLVESQFSLSHMFSNPGATPVTYNLRLQASISVFDSASSAVLAGDYNDDGNVDAADYTVWRDAVGAVEGTLPNDIDGGIIGSAQ